MADILIRNVSATAKERLRKRAARRGRSLEADLRETIETLAREDSTPEEDAPFGSWLRDISRPGGDLQPALEAIRKARPRPVDLS